MRFLICISFLLLTSSSLFSQELECAKFRNGTFRLETEDIGNFIVIRNGNKQKEKHENASKFKTFIITWIDNCTYTIEMTPKTRRMNRDLPDNALMTVHIIKTTENSYIQTTTSNFTDMILTSELFRIK